MSITSVIIKIYLLVFIVLVSVYEIKTNEVVNIDSNLFYKLRIKTLESFKSSLPVSQREQPLNVSFT